MARKAPRPADKRFFVFSLIKVRGSKVNVYLGGRAKPLRATPEEHAGVFEMAGQLRYRIQPVGIEIGAEEPNPMSNTTAADNCPVATLVFAPRQISGRLNDRTTDDQRSVTDQPVLPSLPRRFAWGSRAGKFF